MTKIPPLLPEVTLARVLRLAKFDGTSVLVLGGMFALMAAASGHFPLAVIGLLAAGAGAIELHGAALLRQSDERGMLWLVASQPFLLVVILSYCALRLWIIEIPPAPEQFQALFAAGASQWGMSMHDYLQTLNRMTASAVAIVAIGFQGGMTFYYLRRRAPVARALAVEREDDDVWGRNARS